MKPEDGAMHNVIKEEPEKDNKINFLTKYKFSSGWVISRGPELEENLKLRLRAKTYKTPAPNPW